jgi:4-hydroxy-3-polyprenylbenzoate decarboxylase
MAQLSEIGAVIMPPAPSFYHKPQNIDELVNHTVGKMLSIFNIKHDLFRQWPGLSAPE